MAVSLVQSAGSTASLSVAFGSNNAQGNMLVVAVGMQGSACSVASVSDTQGNTGWAKVTGQQSTDTDGDCEIWFCPQCKAGANTVTVHLNGSIFGSAMEIYELKGTNNIVDKSASLKSTTVTFATITPSTNGAFVIAAVGWSVNESGTNPTGGAGFTLDQSNTRCGAEHLLQASKASVSAVFGSVPSSGSEFGTSIADFIAGGGGHVVSAQTGTHFTAKMVTGGGQAIEQNAQLIRTEIRG